jgi:hypothetical protein
MKTTTVNAPGKRPARPIADRKPRRVDWTASAALRMDKRTLPRLSAATAVAVLADATQAS